ncbi:MAG: hypothetical protein GY803_04365 [Chloroflexi bacterium]|nr:hypothetical protein [Chloroflexota bacterium]
MSIILTETITPWLAGTLILLAVLTLTIAVKSWREMKRSPYFFMRRQAEKRLQTYGSASFILFLFAVAISLYSWQPPTDSVPRMAILTHAKPPKEDVIAFFENAEPAAEALETAEIEQIVASNANTTAAPAFVSVEPALPDAYNQVKPTTKLQDDTALGKLFFSTEITDQYESVNARNLFAEGFYTLFATFSYDEMADGMSWAWIWRHNGELVEGANELWQYGSDGPGFIYFNPDEGFQFGEYSLEVWVNGEMLAQSEVTMNSAALAAGN